MTPDDAASSRRARETAAATDLASGMSRYDVASRHALTDADVQRIADGKPTAEWGRCRSEGCGDKAFRSGYCHGHFRSNYQGLHR